MSQVLTDGNDTAFGAVITNDTLYALNGNDVVIYNASSTGVSPDIYGGEGSDFLGVATDGANGDCEIYGGAGSDTGHGGTESDQLNGDDGNDLLVGGEFSYFDAATTGTIIQFDAATGNDFIYGGAGRDGLYGLDGDDVIYGGDGDDNAGATITTKGDGIFATDYTLIVPGLYGGDGNDFLDGGRGNDLLYGGLGNDIMLGGEGNDDLDGGANNDTLDGGGGNDILNGNDGNDALIGGDGADQFTFNTSLGPLSVDLVKDFDEDADLIVLDQTIFTDIGVKLNKKEFYVGKKAHDNSDRVIYNENNGKLFFDHDGKGGDAKILFAVLDDGLSINKNDFLMVA